METSTPKTNRLAADAFQKQLVQEFERRKNQNSRYSLRAFAKFLDIDPSYLSKLLKAKRPMSCAIENHCCNKLGWISTSSSDHSVKRLKDHYLNLDLDTFRVISNLYHLAIFELIKLKNGQWTPASIAEELSISVVQAQDAVNKLEQLRIIRKKGAGYARSEKGLTTLGIAYTSESLRTLQRDILTRAIAAMETVPIDQRDQTALTLAIPSSKIPKAKKLLTQFRRRFCAIMQKEGTLDSVYQLSLSFYPLTNSVLKRKSH
jgi:DNA-binding Lrp family transcriptional regulator